MINKSKKPQPLVSVLKWKQNRSLYFGRSLCTLTSMGKGMTTKLKCQQTRVHKMLYLIWLIGYIVQSTFYLIFTAHVFCFWFTWNFAGIHNICVSPAERLIIYWLLSIPQNLISACVKRNMLSTLTNVYYFWVTLLWRGKLPIYSLTYTS